MFKALILAAMAALSFSSAQAQERFERHVTVQERSVERHHNRHDRNDRWDRDDRRGHAYGHNKNRHDYDRHDRRHMKKIVKRVCYDGRCKTVVKYVRR